MVNYSQDTFPGVWRGRCLEHQDFHHSQDYGAQVQGDFSITHIFVCYYYVVMTNNMLKETIKVKGKLTSW